MGSTLVAAAIMASAALELEAAHTALTVIDEEQSRGANVLVVENESGSLDGQTCQSLEHQDGVVAAGGVTSADVTSLGNPRLMQVRRVYATRGYFDILNVDVPLSAGRVGAVGVGVQAELGLAPLTELETPDEGRITVVRGVPTMRAEERSRWLTVLVPTLARVQQCWVEADMGAFAAVQATLLPTLGEGAQLKVQTIRSRALLESAMASWEGRWTRWAWLAGGVSAALSCGILLVARRHEYALYRLLGFSRSEVWLIASIEIGLMSLLGVLIGAACTAAYAVLLPPTRLMTLGVIGGTQLLLTVALLYIAIVVVAFGLSAGRTAHVIRNRR